MDDGDIDQAGISAHMASEDVMKLRELHVITLMAQAEAERALEQKMDDDEDDDDQPAEVKYVDYWG